MDIHTWPSGPLASARSTGLSPSAGLVGWLCAPPSPFFSLQVKRSRYARSVAHVLWNAKERDSKMSSRSDRRSSETAAGFSPPPSTLTTGTLSHTQTFTSSSEVVTAYGGYAVTSIRTMRSPIDRSTAKESSFERALTGTTPSFDLQRKNQTVTAKHSCLRLSADT